MKLNKITDKVELNVSAQACHNDCSYWKTESAYLYMMIANYSICRMVTDARWTKWW